MNIALWPELAGWLDSADSTIIGHTEIFTDNRKLNGNIDDRASKRRAAFKRRRS